MVSKRVLLVFFIFCLVCLISQGLARRSSSSSPRPLKTLVECYDAMFHLGFCNSELLRAAQSGRIVLSIGPSCCKAANKITSGCWSMLFPFNPFFSQVLQLNCGRLSLTPPPPFTNQLISNSKGPVAPAPPDALPMGAPSPAVEGPFMDTPNAQTPNVLPTGAPSPTVEGMNTPSDEGDVE
ncbi:prolamin-like domain-containing protein [Tanacetum coccineum]